MRKEKIFANIKAVVSLHIDLFGFFINNFIGRGIYGLLLILYFTKPFHPVINSAITFTGAYLILIALLLIISVKIPRTRERMFQIFGKEYLYKRLGNPMSQLTRLVMSTGALAALDQVVKNVNQ